MLTKIKVKIKISYIIFLFVISCSSSSGQENIKYKFLDRNETHISFIDLCGIEAKKEYIELSKKSNDSIVLYLEGFRQGTELSIYTDNKKHSKTITKHYLIHQMYLDYIIISKTELSASSSLRIGIKSYLPNYPEYSYDYKFRIDNIDNKILNSKSVVIKIEKRSNEEDYVILGYSNVDEVKYEKIKKKCAKRIIESKRKG